jgi:gas vesicle protein
MWKFLLGIGCGMGVGLLIAPRPGEEIRAQLKRLATEPEKLIQEKVAEAREKVGEMGAQLGRQMAEKAVNSVLPEKLATGTDQSSGRTL